MQKSLFETFPSRISRRTIRNNSCFIILGLVIYSEKNAIHRGGEISAVIKVVAAKRSIPVTPLSDVVCKCRRVFCWIHVHGPHERSYSKRKVVLSHVNLHGATISVNFTACLLIFMYGVKGWNASVWPYNSVQKCNVLYLGEHL